MSREPNVLAPLVVHPARPMHTNETAAARELLVAADLIMRGYPVLRSLSYTGRYDLVVEIAGRLLRVNVRTAYKGRDGLVPWVAPRMGAAPVDLTAHVVGAEIAYEPALATFAVGQRMESASHG